ncbi:MAG: flagellar hook-length control protein FliK [Sphingomonadales bacterium]|nr:flagellar hook-length control protein FliK [Sphingomonadales bacterium]
MPHQLGRLEVDVSRSHNGLSLSIQTESDSAKAILSAAQPRLADEIRSQGIKLADTQMFSGDARQSPSQDGFTRPAPLIEAFISPNDTVDEPEPEQRNGRYA